ncbi:hypothetical protein DID74_01575 [Candidatus Marinamargulisbacteria bacterium SCGC AG-333-B06]|nr:hypothetical protein DID74_01575 [Candidatus Marinamargulisbacteria bacterium SCGC AG-333-B06]
MTIKHIIVTGAGGWLGRHLIQALLNPSDSNMTSPIMALNPMIHGIYHPNDIPTLPIQCYKADITNADSIKSALSSIPNEASIIIHTAGVIHPRHPRDFFDVNTQGTKHVLNAIQKFSSIKFIYISSNSPCGCNPHHNHIFTEDSPYNPYMNYGKSKQQAEQLFQQTNVLDYTILRPPWFYGPNQPARQTLFFKLIQSGKFPILGMGKQRRSMVYLDNLVQGIMRACLSSNSKRQTYWISDENSYSMQDIISTVKICLLEAGFHVSKTQLRLPYFLGTIAQWCDFLLQSCNIYHQKMHVLSEMNKTIACDISKAKQELGYVPMISIKEGMQRSIKWCMESKLLVP